MITIRKLKSLWRINRELIKTLPDDKTVSIRMERDSCQAMCHELIAQYKGMEENEMLVSFGALTSAVMQILLKEHEHSLIESLDKITALFRAGLECAAGEDALNDTLNLMCERDDKLYEQGLNKASCSEGDEQNG